MTDPRPAIVVELPSLLAPLIDGVRRVDLRATTLGEALDGLIATHPALRIHLFDESGEIREHVLCLHNDRNSRWTDEPRAIELADGDTVTIMQAVSGG